MRNNRGFTLIELLMVIAIIGVITAIAIPNYMSFRSRTRLQTACREMTTIFQFARAQAVGSNEAWRVHLDPTGNRYFLLDGSSSIYQTIDLEHHRGISFGSHNPAPIDNNHVAPPADGVTYVGEKVKFNPEGTATAGTVYLKNDNGDTMALGTASANGRIKTWKDFGSGWE